MNTTEKSSKLESDRQWQKCLVLLAFPALFHVSPASAITAASGSIRDLGAVLEEAAEAERMTPRAENAVVRDGDRAQVHKPVMNGEDCDDPSQYKVDVAIFGENNLDDGPKNQCKMDQDNLPSAGRLMVIYKGEATQIGSAEAVGRRDILVGAAHSITNTRLTKAQLAELKAMTVFRLYENRDGKCLEVDYPVADFELGTMTSGIETSRDQVVILLEDQIPANYKPLPLASNQQIVRALKGDLDVHLRGFPNHKSNNYGKDLADVPCKRIYRHRVQGMIQHDCDGWSGMSGGTLRVVEDNQSYFFGTHNKGHDEEFDEFDENFNEGVLLQHWLREVIHDFSSSPTT